MPIQPGGAFVPLFPARAGNELMSAAWMPAATSCSPHARGLTDLSRSPGTHNPTVEQPAAVTDVLLAFLTETPPMSEHSIIAVTGSFPRERDNPAVPLSTRHGHDSANSEAENAIQGVLRQLRVAPL